jgi:ABC-type antimicrobial peptide transport system permease subunit
MTTYFPYRMSTGGQLVVMCVSVRTHGDPRALAGPVRDAMRRADPTLAVLGLNTVDDQIDDVLAQDRLIAALSGFFGGVAGLLACLGLYGLVAQMVARRTAEIAVRMALGATASGVMLRVMRDGALLAVIGIVVGIPATAAVTPLVAAYLFGVGRFDPATIAVASSLILAVALVATFLPARRAAHVDPAVALRDAGGTD